MPWLQIQLLTSPDHAEAVEALLTEAGAVAVTYQDAADEPVFEPNIGTTPLWGRTQVIGLFESDTDIDAVYLHLQTTLDASTLASYQLNTLADQPWERTWMDTFHPMRFGQHTWICPSWHALPDEPDAITILLDPGLAFGTGTHPTTALCLTWLDRHPPQNESVIDYGCGSGILAIAALKLGAKSVWAIDHDAQALEATLENAHRNQLTTSSLQTAFPDDAAFKTAHLQQGADLLLANILAQPLITLAPNFANLLNSKGKIVLSGILAPQVDEILETYQAYFDLNVPEELDGWFCITGQLNQQKFPQKP